MKDNDLIELHDLDSGQMLGSLRLGYGFIARDKKKSSVHDCGSRQHSAHENIVTRAIDEAGRDKISRCFLFVVHTTITSSPDLQTGQYIEGKKRHG